MPEGFQPAAKRDYSHFHEWMKMDHEVRDHYFFSSIFWALLHTPSLTKIILVYLKGAKLPFRTEFSPSLPKTPRRSSITICPPKGVMSSSPSCYRKALGSTLVRQLTQLGRTSHLRISLAIRIEAISVQLLWT